MYFQNFPLYEVALAFAVALITIVIAESNLSSSTISSRYFLAASLEGFKISFYKGN
jgi:hypothetical protein